MPRSTIASAVDAAALAALHRVFAAEFVHLSVDLAQERRVEGRGVLVGYLPVGFPDLATSIDAAVALVENGVDAIELGLPYSDPVMDGIAIQQATQAALAAGFRIRDVFTAVEAVRSRRLFA